MRKSEISDLQLSLLHSVNVILSAEFKYFLKDGAVLICTGLSETI